VSSVCDMWCHDVKSKGLGNSHPCGLSSCISLGLSPGLAGLATCRFSQWTVCVLGISNFLGSPLHLWLHSHSFMRNPTRDCCRDSDPITHCPVSQSFLLKSGWKPPWPHNSCILHACKTSIVFMIPRSAASWDPLTHAYSDLSGAWWLNMGKHFPRQPWNSLFKTKSFKLVKTFAPLSLQSVGSG
jgi:hypothetical protein